MPRLTGGEQQPRKSRLSEQQRRRPSWKHRSKMLNETWTLLGNAVERHRKPSQSRSRPAFFLLNQDKLIS